MYIVLIFRFKENDSYSVIEMMRKNTYISKYCATVVYTRSKRISLLNKILYTCVTIQTMEESALIDVNIWLLCRQG